MIRTIEWNNDIVLGDLKLDFQKEDGTIYNTVVFAGENGSGKTSILESLSDFLNLGSIIPLKKIEYDTNGNTFIITCDEQHPEYGWHKRTNKSTGVSRQITSNKTANKDLINEDLEDIRHYGCIYSKARSGFNTKPIKSSTTQQIDVDKYDDDKSDDFTSIKQLIVDIKGQDNSAWDKIGAKGESISYQEFRTTSKIYRFEKAFNDFFENIKFDGVNEDSVSEKSIEFSKNNNSIKIDDLSTGEKQVVFRGAQLLKNSNNLDGGVILIDEPELSMHPKWQAKILDYYRNLFIKSGLQTTQMFFATHSENVIRSAIEDKDNVLIIILSDENGIIKADKMKDTVLPTTTAAEINYLAFDVKSVDYHIALYGDFQTQTGKNRIEDADAELALQTEYDSSIHAKPDSFGRSTYNTLPTYIRNAIDHPDSGRRYTDAELELSIKLLRDVCKRLRSTSTTP